MSYKSRTSWSELLIIPHQLRALIHQAVLKSPLAPVSPDARGLDSLSPFAEIERRCTLTPRLADRLEIPMLSRLSNL